MTKEKTKSHSHMTFDDNWSLFRDKTKNIPVIVDDYPYEKTTCLIKIKIKHKLRPQYESWRSAMQTNTMSFALSFIYRQKTNSKHEKSLTEQ